MRAWFPVVVPAILASVGSCAVASEEVIARVRAEAPTAWTSAMELSRHLDAEVVKKSHGPAGVTEVVWSCKFSGNNGLRIMRVKQVPPGSTGYVKGEENVFCRNSRYGFHLVKRSEAPQWYLSYFGSDLSGIDKELEESGGRSLAINFLYLGPERLPNLFVEPGFHVKDAKSVMRDQRELIQLDFDRVPPPAGKQFRVTGGKVLLDPSLMWAVVEFQADVSNQKTKASSRDERFNSFKPSPRGFPLLEKSHLVRMGVEDDWEFTRFEQVDIPEDAFTLAAFGLPEVVPSSGWRVGPWIALATGIVILGLALFGYLRQPRSSHTKP